MKQIFGNVDNLSGFIHPRFNEKFEFMNEKQSIDLAKCILDKFIKTNIKNILVIESGTSPLIKIMKDLDEFKNTNLNIIQIKIPRDLDFYLYGWFKEYLTKEEFELRKDTLKKLCTNNILEELVGNDKFSIYDSVKATKKYKISTREFQECLKGTKLSEIFNQEFLVFDEYINAGTIIRNLNGMVKLFTDNINYKLSSFCMFLDNPEEIDRIAFTLYDNSTELSCYRNGAYPFENRIDLIGYYFFIDKYNFEKVYLEDLKIKISDKLRNEDVEKFLNHLNDLIAENNLLDKLKSAVTVDQVRDYVVDADIIRFVLKDMEETFYGKSIYSDFYDQVYELYAPAWSPMPVVNHLDYWESFRLVRNDISSLYEGLKNYYEQVRFDLINYVLDVLIEHNKEFKIKIDEEISK